MEIGAASCPTVGTVNSFIDIPDFALTTEHKFFLLCISQCLFNIKCFYCAPSQ
jgi:hypothetical protein